MVYYWKFNFFNILVESSYPIFLSFFLFSFFFSLMIFFKVNFYFFFCISFFFLFFCLLVWVKNVFVESLIGNHSFFMQDGFKVCFYYFLFSELMFFFSLFWFFFDTSLVPLEELGIYWVPSGLEMVNPFSLPFLNSLILLGSAITLTYVHYNFLKMLKNMYFFFFTLLLGLMFLSFQIFEYKMMMFSFSDGIFGSIFYFMTGFHGLHVFFGLIFLLMNFFLLINNNLLMSHHLSFEFSIIYWHFVDVIWLYLFIFLYWWS
uniref:Cytochrome c oxidase subunit 3 n=1 Tax=Meloidogyne chitwoodi TaxID=59747 RepID=A0A023VWK3_MELCH|nr:cytochrome c oxidase subunit III [Meloidogyne chitwoodi]